ncbi:MAG: MFS transporter [bacterium]|nr:MFS transporter [bacterium]
MITRWIVRLTPVRREESAAVLLSAAYFFCVLCGYYILRPLREEMGLAGGVDGLPKLYLVNLGIMLLAAPVFGLLVNRFPRRVFVPAAYRFFIANLLVFWALLRWPPHGSDLALGRVFYVWVSVFNMWAVSLFWAVMADGWNLERSKRLFGFIAVGGSAGGLAGAGLTALLVGSVGRIDLLLLSAAMLELAVRCLRALPSRLPARAEGEAPEAEICDAPRRAGALAGIVAVARSPYLLGVALYLVLYTVSSTILYFAQANIVEAAAVGREARAAIFARIDAAVNGLTLLLQLGVAGRLIPRLGVGGTLLIVPALTAVGFAVLGAVPTLTVLAVFQVLRRASNYALMHPARETLFTVVSREQRFKSKSFLDTFVYRGGDALGASLYTVLGRAGLGLAGLAVSTVPVAVLWGALGLALGAAQRRLALKRQETPT